MHRQKIGLKHKKKKHLIDHPQNPTHKLRQTQTYISKP